MPLLLAQKMFDNSGAGDKMVGFSYGALRWEGRDMQDSAKCHASPKAMYTNRLEEVKENCQMERVR